jgi:predicted metal-dependent peptidase
MLRQFMGEVNAILEDLMPEEVHVLLADTKVNAHEVYTADDLPIEIEAKGRGGTRFQPAFDYVEANLDDPPECAVYLTDMDPSDKLTVKDPGYPLLWCDFSLRSRWQPSFGDVIKVV